MATRTDVYFRCDRCGSERPCRNPSDHHAAHVTYDIVNSQIGSGSGGKRDLCHDCYRDLHHWFTNSEIKIERIRG